MDKRTAVTITFADILTSFDLKHVTFSTHIHGHWLDLVITRSTCDHIQTLTVSDGLLDHHTVIDVNFSRTLVQSKHNVSYRRIHKTDIDTFKADILKSDLIGYPK